jgi:outer membrane receptor protein involved in Fe transport
MFTQPQGLRAYVVADYVGKRWLDKENTALAGDYTTIDAGVGYAWDRWEVRVDGYNLSDRRDPVSESELGDSQFYRLPARTYWLTARYTFGTH